MRISIKLRIIFLTILIFQLIRASAQNEKESSEEQQENRAERDEQAADDDIDAEELKFFQDHPLNMNDADEDDLKALHILSPLQIQHFIAYRKMLGRLISIYELQAVPFWDILMIEKVLPYIRVEEDNDIVRGLRQRLRGGARTFLARYSQVPEKSAGYMIKDSSSHYAGNGMKLLLKYKYAFKNQLQYGFVAEKDAGEPFFKARQRYGFDFYSAHFFIRKLGMVKALVLGDFAVNLGQGLIIWQGMGAGKSSDVMAIKRQAPVLKPYYSSGEYNFQRGGGMTLALRHLEATAFISKRKLDAVMVDSQSETIITSINISGFHRTQNENNHKENAGLVTMGLNIRYKGNNWFSTINLVNFKYSDILQKRDDPYNYFALKGRSFTYAGTGYGYTYRNMHFFGELAVLGLKHKAMLNGLLVSLDKRVEAAILIRNIDRAYNSSYGSAFTENTSPGNENGIYTGITIRTSTELSFSAYADFFSFPWLKYRIDAPSSGKEYLVYMNYKPDKKTELYIRYRYRSKAIKTDEPRSALSMSNITQQPYQNLRIHSILALSRSVTLRNRVEVVWLNLHKNAAEQGFLLFTDLLFKPMAGSWSGNLRVASFETDGYDSRLYAYENDVLYSSSVTAYFYKGSRYFVNISKKIIYRIGGNKLRLNFLVRWSQSFSNQSVISSGLDEIPGKKKSEVKVELIIL